MQTHALVYEYRQSLFFPRVQLCVREVVRCVRDVTVVDSVQLWHSICVQNYIVINFPVINARLVIRGE
jgi:hypothetical protein